MVTVTELVEDWHIVCVISAAQHHTCKFVFIGTHRKKKENLLQNNTYTTCMT